MSREKRKLEAYATEAYATETPGALHKRFLTPFPVHRFQSVSSLEFLKVYLTAIVGLSIMIG